MSRVPLRTRSQSDAMPALVLEAEVMQSPLWYWRME